MITTFQEVGNGSVAITGLQPQPISGQAVTVNNFALVPLTTLVLPKDANGIALDGVFGGELLINARSGLDIISQLLFVVIRRTIGITFVSSITALATFVDVPLGGFTVTPTISPQGDVIFNVTSGPAPPPVLNWSALGIFLMGP